MDKPLSLRIKELKLNLIKAVQEASLPAFLCVEPLDSVTNQIKLLADQQSQQEENEYKNSLKEEK